jgi:hypothetical protein
LNVDTPALLRRQGVDGGGVRDVDRHGLGPAPSRLQALGHRGRCGEVEIGHHHGGALRHQGLAKGEPDAARPAGDDRDPTGPDDVRGRLDLRCITHPMSP